MAGGATASGLDYLAGLMTTGETAVNSYYLALIPELEPGFSSTGETIVEPTAGDYARAEIVNESSAWSVNNQSLTNTYEVQFLTATSPWGTIRYWAICDEPVGGRVFFVGEMTDLVYVDTGGTVIMDPGTITLWFEGTQWKFGGR